MPSCPRSDVVSKGEVGVYHCWNRCVRRAYLCGFDEASGVDFEYRRGWITQLERYLVGLFAIEVGFHAEMANHLHVILRTRPDLVSNWCDEEVVRRWLTITRLKRNGSDKLVHPTEAQIARELKRPGRVAKLRERLSDISWFMGTLCENLSRRCNREDECTGAFWEGRFQCSELVDEAAIFVCGMYVDLNQIRAGEVDTPEQSRHTSVYDRIQGLMMRRGRTAATGPDDHETPDGWLCELSSLEQAGFTESSADVRPASGKGLLPVTLEKYLALLDWTGRELRSNKRGSIPSSLAPILDRLGINPDHWLESVAYYDQWFGLVVGSVDAVRAAARRVGRRWFRGQGHCAQAFR